MQQERTDNWHEYLMEAGELGVFMISACIFTTVLEHPGSPVHQWIGSAFVRRTIIGAGMGLTAIGLIYSPWGKQSGAHLNPSVTVTFLRLGKLRTDRCSLLCACSVSWCRSWCNGLLISP